MKTILVFNVFEHIEAVDAFGKPLVLSNLNYSQQFPDFLTQEQAVKELPFIANPDKNGFVILPVHKLVTEEEATKHELTLKLKDMKNQRMKEKIVSGEAIDLADNVFIGGAYLLTEFIDGKDYCDSKNEAWIWSIGKSIKDGNIYAATNAGFYQNEHFECLFLR